MMRPTRDAIQSYMSITGASDSLAIQRLEEHGNNLPEAINAHFRDVERSIYDNTSLDSRSEYTVVQDNNQVRGFESRPVPGALPSILSAARNFRPPLLLDSNYRRNILRQLGGSALSGNPSPSSHTGEVIGFPAHSAWGNDQVHPPRPADNYARHSPSYESQIPGGTHRDADSPLNSNDTEEEMIRAAIEASKKDFQEGRHNAKYGLDNDPSRLLSPRNDQAHPSQLADAYARDSPSYGFQVPGGTHRDPDSPHNSNDAEEEMIRAAIEASKKDFQEGRHNTRYSLDNDPSRFLSPRAVINREDEDIARAISMSLEVEEQDSFLRDQLAEFMPHSMEHHNPCQSSTNPRSSALQDKREEMKQKQPVNNRSQHGHDFQNIRTSYPEEESVRSSTTKKTAVPIEPSAENEDAITLLVKMPDSSRHGRRFLKSDKLKYLFDFIDAAGLVKPGTYRMVRAYPRRAFSLQDASLSFEELSLTNKQEALFLELLI